MNQSSNLNEFVEIAQKKSPSFVIVAFNSAWWIITQVTLSHLKEPKLFIILKLLTIKFTWLSDIPALGCPCHSSFANENKDKSKFIKPECGKSQLCLWISVWQGWYKNLGFTSNVRKKMILGAFTFLKRISNDDQYIYIYIYIYS